jgi:predicted transposase YdaD
MLFTEWNQEEALEYRYNEGLNKGRNEGRDEDIKNLLDFGMSSGQIAQALKLPLDTVLQHKETK